MGRPIVDLTGKKFGMLTVLGMDNRPRTGHDPVWWICKCDCGNVKSIRGGDIKQRGKEFKNVSCGCYKHKRFLTHGEAGTRLYGVWNAIKQRCYNPTCREYKFYGAHGISMCDEWRYNYESFMKWCIEHGYDKNAPRGKTTIDRIDVYGNYEPNNCRFITMLSQSRNRRNTILLTHNGKTQSLPDWSDETGLSQRVIWDRLKEGWNVSDALTIPKRKHIGGKYVISRRKTVQNARPDRV